MSIHERIQEQASAAAEFIQKRWSRKPRLGMVLGTGSGQIADRIDIDHAFDYGDIPHFPQSTALGHQGRLVCGTLFDFEVVAMQGRFHLYEGHAYDDVMLPIPVFGRLGIERLFVTNAAGGINPKFKSGELMAITSHLDFMYATSQIYGPTETGQSVDRPLLRTDQVYDKELVQMALSAGRQNDFVVHTGTYAGLLGPNYETRAEYRMLRKIGGDVAGMSTIPEVSMAALEKIPTLAISVITNVAKPDVLEATSGQEVIDAAKVAEPNLLAIVKSLTQPVK